MGLISWLLGGKRTDRQKLFWNGTGEFEFAVVGESHYQEVLSGICGGYCEEGYRHGCTATIVPEQNNPYDRNAVAVYIGGQKVAYLSRDDAAQYRKALKNHDLGIVAVECDALIVGGWDRGNSNIGYFGVKLDLALPLELAGI